MAEAVEKEPIKNWRWNGNVLQVARVDVPN